MPRLPLTINQNTRQIVTSLPPQRAQEIADLVTAGLTAAEKKSGKIDTVGAWIQTAFDLAAELQALELKLEREQDALRDDLKTLMSRLQNLLKEFTIREA